MVDNRQMAPSFSSGLAGPSSTVTYLPSQQQQQQQQPQQALLHQQQPLLSQLQAQSPQMAMTLPSQQQPMLQQASHSQLHPQQQMHSQLQPTNHQQLATAPSIQQQAVRPCLSACLHGSMTWLACTQFRPALGPGTCPPAIHCQPQKPGGRAGVPDGDAEEAA
jgi:hypothetical protein